MADVQKAIGLVIEPDGFDVALAAVSADIDVRAGMFLSVRSARAGSVLAVVHGVRSAGGIFTRDTAGFHLAHLNDLSTRAPSSFQICELQFVARVEGSKVVDRRPGPLAAGSSVFEISAKQLSLYLDIGEDGFRIGNHSQHSEVRVRMRPEDLLRGHTAIVGQTGSGKTNVLRLLHDGVRRAPRAKYCYVLFDFHDEFDELNKRERSLVPPFSFGPGDLKLEILEELLPNLSVPQLDLLALALDQSPGSIAALKTQVERMDGNESSKRVVLRRLARLERAAAFSLEDDVGNRVAMLAQPGAGTILRLGAVQTELAQLFIGTVVRRLMVERMRGRIPPVIFLVDEAHRLMSTKSSPSATRTFRFVAQEGRKFGVTMALATQRPSLVDSTILSQCATMLALRLTSPEDARAVTQVMTEIRPTDLGSLGTGQGILSRAWSTDLLWVDFDLAARADAAPKTQFQNQQDLFDA
jgi:DNA helicase HerA-like ATPase